MRILGFIAKALLTFIISLALLTALLLAVLQSRFSENLPVIGGYRPLIVYSGSMEPTLRVGSIVFVGPVHTGEIQTGEIITFHSPDNPDEPTGSQLRLTTHRISRVIDTGSEHVFETKGDANDDVDSGYVSESRVVGKASLSIPYIGYASSYLRSKYGLAVLIGLAVCFALVEIGRAATKMRSRGSYNA